MSFILLKFHNFFLKTCNMSIKSQIMLHQLNQDISGFLYTPKTLEASGPRYINWPDETGKR